jgi:hypothetical protein
MRLAAFFHCWAAGAWREPAFEFLDALEESEFPGPLFLGLVGSVEQRQEAVAEIRSRRPGAGVRAEADGGNEEATLQLVERYARRAAGAVLYAHTHGATHGDHGYGAQSHRENRRRMIDGLIRGWRECVRRLEEDGVDVVGLGWGGQCFHGNWWMARCDYLRRLPPAPRSGTPHRAPLEWWIGLGRPRVTSAPLRVALVDRFSTSSSPAALADACNWMGCPGRAAADLFLLQEAERWLRKLTSRGWLHPATSPAMIGKQQADVATLPEEALRSVVDMTAAAFPGWSLQSDAAAPLLERLDQHFASVQRAHLEWQGLQVI